MAEAPEDGWEVGDDPTVSPDAQVVATAPERSDLRVLLRERWVRWLFTGVLVVFLGLGAIGVWGVRSTTTSASGGGYDVEVTYGAVTRPGLATPFEIEIRRDGGWPEDGSVQVAVSVSYLAMFDENGLDPDPAASTTTADAVVWEFDPPAAGTTLVVSLDARVEPGVQWGRDGFVRIVEEEATVVEAEFRTWVAP